MIVGHNVEGSTVWGISLPGTRRVQCWFFFFQAEDGIRDIGVTGVQTCALPIWMVDHDPRSPERRGLVARARHQLLPHAAVQKRDPGHMSLVRPLRSLGLKTYLLGRSEGRRVG